MEAKLHLSKESKSPMVDTTKYRRIVGSLRYLIHTRSDITYSVGIVSRFMENPTTEHLAAVKHLLRYIAGMINLGCSFTAKGEEKLTGYSDRAWPEMWTIEGVHLESSSCWATIQLLGTQSSRRSWHSVHVKLSMSL
jgi:hypothetical protein